jgi:hypothetical protein
MHFFSWLSNSRMLLHRAGWTLFFMTFEFKNAFAQGRLNIRTGGSCALFYLAIFDWRPYVFGPPNWKPKNSSFWEAIFLAIQYREPEFERRPNLALKWRAHSGSCITRIFWHQDAFAQPCIF